MRSLTTVLVSIIACSFFYHCGTKASSEEIIDRKIKINGDSPYPVSAVINDDDDPASVHGIDFAIGDEFANSGELSITATSSNTTVVPDKNLILSGSGNLRNLRITPAAPGYSTITITVSNGNKKSSYTLNYAASQTTKAKDKRWHTGISDASAAIILDPNYMIVANDETNYLYLFNRNHSGLPVKVYDFNKGNILGLTDTSSGAFKEVDIEGAVRSTTQPSVIYWIGSMSNNGVFFNRPNRNRLFATSISGKGPETNINYVGHYSELRKHLITWGDKHGYDFGMSAAIGKDPKLVDGFNIEGMVFGPDNKTMFICFRAPLVPTGNRTKAVIAPIQNFEAWFNNGKPVNAPTIGEPIELDLGNRGIRDMIRQPNGNFIIIAGSCGPDIIPAVFTWSGNRTDAPKISSMDIGGLNVEGVIPIYENGKISANKFQVLTDNGEEVYYTDTVSAKDLMFDNFKKFSSVVCTIRQ